MFISLWRLAPLLVSSLSLTVVCFIFYHLLLNCNLQFAVVDIDESIPYILR